ncbi:MAG TPA: sulfide/dihydroorotate dehydrogenase-like FAD/NAD-binding protein [Victivallales bacterium]|nr:sulfide/dihydroorotate dehydrogenase-like FAD/NAD-binding protein [Victivallales bacterium]HPO89705.1 sulfide/dihydroorotate dehydrogenase-like FAD/NAD-binding protein [Victivallales bacterium]HRR29041.1 sulfide/dihydroorotate dehydrogenase-like FAD/NAD-binding protein [Victivallales bacterium]HRU00193.1 sulfide/dihydroorotate dehydrogenase-like FAD/NAD-binding protein [Victivallales bacterium]
MNKIKRKIKLSENVYRMDVEAPLIASERKAGQFIILSLDDNYAERIPLTIADANTKEGTITLIFQVVGATTKKLSRLEKGDFIDNLLGPLGKPTHIEKFGTVVCVGGGIGVAPMHPIAQEMKNAGNKVISIIGARNKELLILEEEFKRLSDELIICTDDGSYGRKALVTEPLKEICSKIPPPDLVIAIGPPIMMKFCSITTKPFNIKTLVSLNTIMVDGTGMCGGCRVTVGGQTKFVCVDGPEFDGHLVDFDNMMKRLNAFKNIERKKFEDECKLETEIKKMEKKNG